MKNTFLLIAILWGILVSIASAQSVQGSFIIENAFLYTNTKITMSNYSVIHTKELEYWPMSFAFGIKFHLDEVSKLELHPGLQFAGVFFTGAELGIFYRRYIYKNIFSGFGVMLHLNYSDNHGNQRRVSVNNGLYVNPGILFGINFFKNISGIISIYKTTNSFYGTISYHDFITGETKVYRPELLWIFKGGIEINFN